MQQGQKKTGGYKYYHDWHGKERGFVEFDKHDGVRKWISPIEDAIGPSFESGGPSRLSRSTHLFFHTGTFSSSPYTSTTCSGEGRRTRKDSSTQGSGTSSAPGPVFIRNRGRRLLRVLHSARGEALPSPGQIVFRNSKR